MPCEIHERHGYVEVRVTAGARKFELLSTVAELGRRDPAKRRSDLWLFAEDVPFSYADFATTAEAILRMCPPGMHGNRSALVGGSMLQKAQLELFCQEATDLPFEIRAFGDETTAIRWLTHQALAGASTPSCHALNITRSP